ncbi:MAG: HugZ family protein [Proteobacteria bacterium]|nr:HugZ family protein [Pseudomonadota bacterium]
MTDKKRDVLQPVDDEAKRLGKTLVRSARYGSLATLDPLDGSPSVSRVSLATAMNGAPIFLMSQLSSHCKNLITDARCSLLVGEPGKGDPLAHPRMTLIGTAVRIPEGSERTFMRSRYLRRHPKAALYVDFPDFSFWRFEISRASLNGGFGKAYAVTARDLTTSLEGVEQLAEIEEGAVAHMNADHVAAIEKYAAMIGEKETGWRLATLDPEGLDLTVGDRIARLWFDRPLASASDLRPTLVSLAKVP